MADKDPEEDYEVRRPQGFLTPPDDTTVGGDGFPYAGIGNGSLPEPLRQIGEPMRSKLFPGK